MCGRVGWFSYWSKVITGRAGKLGQLGISDKDSECFDLGDFNINVNAACEIAIHELQVGV